MLAEVLLRRTTARAVSRLYPTLVEEYPDIHSLVHASEKKLEEEVAAVGLKKQRTTALKSAASVIAEKYEGKVPTNREQLLLIPYIGSYTASAILSFGFGIPAVVVDSNVERILRRLFVSGLVGLRVTTSLLVAMGTQLLPQEEHEFFNWGLLDLGALVCVYGIPQCRRCPLSPCCDTGASIAHEGNRGLEKKVKRR
jgi:A/G-specific adenine glycosylase